MTTHHDLPSWEFMISSPCEVTFSKTPVFVHTVGHQEGGKREWETEKETKRSLDFVRLESQKTHKTKSMTFT